MNIQVAACATFANLNSIDFGVTLNGPIGANISDIQATNGFGTTSGFNSGTHYFLNSSTQADVIWSTTTMENLIANQAFIVIQVNVPPGSAPGTLSITLDGGTNGLAGATQNMGTTSPSVPLTFDPLSIPCNSTINPATTSTVSASGTITFMSQGTGVATTSVLLQNTTAGTVSTATTSATPSPGTYSLTGITAGDNVKITPSKTNSASLGASYVNITDAILLERYVQGPLLFPAATHGMIHPSQALAGDADYDGDIDFVDVVRIRQSIVGFPAQQYIRTDWVFYPTTTAFSSMPFYNYTAPLMQCFSGAMTASNPNINFIGVKVGDVNETANLAAMPSPEARSSANFMVADQAIAAGTLVEIPVYAQDFADLFGYQTNIVFDTDYMQFAEVELGTALPDMELADFGTHSVESGVIPAIWGGLENANLVDGDLLFTLKFNALRDAESLKDLLSLRTANNLVSLAFDGSLFAQSLGLEFTDVLSSASEVSEKAFVLYPSTPNPFSERTKVSFDLPQASNVNIVITDLTGRVVYTRTASMSAGYNEFLINKNDLNASGVYYYQIKASNYEASSKMILID